MKLILKLREASIFSPIIFFGKKTFLHNQALFWHVQNRLYFWENGWQKYFLLSCEVIFFREFPQESAQEFLK